MTQTPNQRGTSFEDRVEAVLADLRSNHPSTVEFERRYTLTLRTGRVVYPDFMLRVKEPDAIHERLIECQSRDTSSHAVIDKIHMIRNNSDRNRFVFVHEAAISDAVRRELLQHGITAYQFDDFAAFITATAEKLTAIVAEHRVAPSNVSRGPAPVQPAGPARIFQPHVERGFGNSPGITTRVGFGNSARSGPIRGR